MNSLLGKCYNQGFKYLTRVIWCVVSGVVFWRTYEHYKNGLEYVYLHEILGSWLCLARGSAAVLNLNCAVVLLPMCHTLILLFNKAIRKISRNVHWLKIETKPFHIFIGYVILIMTGIHVTAHVVNIHSFCDNFHDEFQDVNPFPYKPKVHSILFETVTGVTGLLMLLMLLLIYLTSLKIVRRRTFNTFWYSHRVFVIFYLLFVIHGFRGPLRKQLNVIRHVPGCHRNSSGETTVFVTGNFTLNSTKYGFNETCSEKPEFGPIGCQTWLWVCIPLLLYLLDVLCRTWRREHVVNITDVQLVTEDVLELAIENPEMKVRPGQYVFVNCGRISTLEWHPFSVVQVPMTSNGWLLKLWIKVAGDWTEQFLQETKAAVKDVNCETQDIRYPPIKLDGPYSSSMENVTKYRTAICIAGGVGITPFLSHILYQADDSNQKRTKLKHMHLILVGRDEQLLTRSDSIIYGSSVKVKNKTETDIQLFYTGKSTTPTLTDAGTVISKGRPPFEDIFSIIHNSNKRSTIGVFACGPAALCSAIAIECNRSTSLNTRFIFHKESF